MTVMYSILIFRPIKVGTMSDRASHSKAPADHRRKWDTLEFEKVAKEPEKEAAVEEAKAEEEESMDTETQVESEEVDGNEVEEETGPAADEKSEPSEEKISESLSRSEMLRWVLF